MECAGKDKAAYVQDTFNQIARQYDRLNLLMSLGQDSRWRRLAVKHVGAEPGSNILDVCCGTGKLSLELARAVGPKGTVTGVDFSCNMLTVAEQGKGQSPVGDRIHFQQGDAMQLPFADNTFDGATVGWGLRNLPDLEQGIREMLRVVKPGGMIVSLDMGKPAFPVFKQVYWLYFEKLVPLMGKIWAGKKNAYQYLYESSREFPSQKRLALVFEKCGLEQAQYKNLLGGVVALVKGSKPLPPSD